MATDTPIPESGAEDDGKELSLRDELEAAFQAEPTDDEPPVESRERDERGRFKSKGEEPPQETPETPQAPPTDPTQGQGPSDTPIAPAPPPGDLKAPASWRPEIREKWGAVDTDVKAEIHRREREHQLVLQNSAQARQFVDAFEKTIAPYQVFIRAEQSNPLQAVDNLMGMAALLRTGTPVQKAQLLDSIISQHGIDVQMLDNVIAARMYGQSTPATGGQAFHDPRVDQLLQQQQLMMQQQAQAEQVEMQQGIEAFASAAGHEFFNDVRHTMADMIEIAAKQGKVMPLEEAYKKACKLDDGISKIMASRQTAQNPRALTQAALRAKRAASSVKGDTTPHGATVPKDDSIRSALEAAFEESDER